MDEKLTLTVRSQGERISAAMGASLFWVELMDHGRNVVACGVNIGGPTVWHIEVDGIHRSTLAVAHDVLRDVLRNEDQELPAEVREWAKAHDATLARVQAFCGGAL